MPGTVGAGVPMRVRSENGIEFSCDALVNWIPGAGARPLPVATRSPSEKRDQLVERSRP